MKTRHFTLLIAACTLFQLSFAQVGLVANYPFNGNANDAGINQLHGTIMGNPTLVADRLGNANSAFQFDGIDDHIDLGASALLKPTTGVTLALWAQHDNWSSITGWEALAGNTSSGGYELVVHGSASVFESEVNRNSAYGIANYPLSSLNSNWHHFALTYDTRYNVLYVDGIAVDTDDAFATYPIHYTYPGNHTLIGAEAGTVGTEGDYFSGKIDEVRFYDLAMSAPEILELYNNSVSADPSTEVSNALQLFPNPTADRLQIQWMSTMKMSGSISIIDLTGRTVLGPQAITVQPGLNEWPLDLSALAPGVYSCKLETSKERLSTKVLKLK